jgi:hypothetical protein
LGIICQQFSIAKAAKSAPRTLVQIAANDRFPPFVQNYCIAAIGDMGLELSFTENEKNGCFGHNRFS